MPDSLPELFLDVVPVQLVLNGVRSDRRLNSRGGLEPDFALLLALAVIKVFELAALSVSRALQFQQVIR